MNEVPHIVEKSDTVMAGEGLQTWEFGVTADRDSTARSVRDLLKVRRTLKKNASEGKNYLSSTFQLPEGRL